MRALIILSLCLLTACGPRQLNDSTTITGKDDITPSAFRLCSGYGCKEKHDTGLNTKEWKAVQKIFTPKPKTASIERERIRQAIALLEKTTGPKIGTQDDKGGTFEATRNASQMDCLDEATNAQTYLTLLDEAKLLRFHTIEGRARRGGWPSSWPHTAALIKETATNTKYVVDSWFLDNGKPPYILTRQQWQAGWQPNHDKLLKPDN